MGVFDASDIVQFAVRIEENGMSFYRYAVRIAKDEDTKKLFNHLADEEERHKEFFEKLFAEMEKYAPPERYAGEYEEYLRGYVDNNVIFKKEVLEKELQQIGDTLAAVDFAIRREIDSIFYYSEIKKLVSPAQHGALEKVIDEERTHFTTLSEARKRYRT